ncbi:MAG: hypothetical protein RLY87_25 [Chloroflexota bacterium]|jgi:hypothetical protein
MDGISCLFVFFSVAILGVWIILVLKKRAELAQLLETYQNSLTILRSRPTDPEVHERTLRAGRAYASATRNKTGVTLFDETALANDIRAVTANASQSSNHNPKHTPAAVQVKSKTETIDDRIAALQKLRAADMLTDEEFEQKRRDILNSI